MHFDNETLESNFSRVYAKELYDHVRDEEENVNVEEMEEYVGVVKYLAWILRNQFSV